MKKILHIEDFGKVKKADIDLQDFVLFVGDNNSGKTYVMQLIYGVFNYINHFDHVSNKLYNNYTEIFTLLKDKHDIDKNEFQSHLDYFNKCLSDDIDNIIESTFNYKIDIGKIWLEIDLEDLQFNFNFYQEFDFSRGIPVGYNKNISSVYFTDDYVKKPKDNGMSSFDLSLTFSDNYDILYEKHYPFIIGGNLNEGIYRSLYNKVITMMLSCVFNLKDENLYLPSSRAGLHLLYKDYFVSIGDRNFASQINQLNTSNIDSKLTKPVYDYLRYLQKWEKDSKIIEKNSELLHFFENHLIKGKYEKNTQLEYIPEGTEHHIPMYLTSSMISELIPFYYYITSDMYTNSNYLMIDEAEACLHPKKQMELVRLLVRINNDGKRIIMSTHSDSMASKINNMVVLANKVRLGKEKDLNKLQLSNNDLFNSSNIKVYSFLDKGLYSEVKEVEYDNRLGFSFKQFEDSFSRLYDEAKIVFNEE